MKFALTRLLQNGCRIVGWQLIDNVDDDEMMETKTIPFHPLAHSIQSTPNDVEQRKFTAISMFSYYFTLIIQ